MVATMRLVPAPITAFMVWRLPRSIVEQLLTTTLHEQSALVFPNLRRLYACGTYLDKKPCWFCAGSLADVSETEDCCEACCKICLPYAICGPFGMICCTSPLATSLVKRILRNWNIDDNEVNCIKVQFCSQCVASQVSQEIKKRKAAGQMPQMKKGMPTQMTAPMQMQQMPMQMMVQPQYVTQPTMTTQPVYVGQPQHTPQPVMTAQPVNVAQPVTTAQPVMAAAQVAMVPSQPLSSQI
eukprot:261796-Prorocentrum_minimum.AAC.1